jgi:hypothetical protein
MLPIRILGLIVIATLAATGLVGATSASAETSTQLCNAHEEMECPEGKATTSVHMTLAEGVVGKLLNSLVTILCLGVLVEATPLALGSPQEVHTLSSSYTGCGSGSAHNNCTVTVEEEPLALLLTTGLDEGSLTVDSGRTRLNCSNLGIDCKYDSAGLFFEVGEQHLTAEATSVIELGGKLFCPEKGTLDGLLKALKATYVLGEPEPTNTTALCKIHSAKRCAKKDLVKSLHVVTTKPPIFYNTVANIECESSLGTVTVLKRGKSQELDVTKLTWEGCHTQGAADNCTVTSKALPTLDLTRTALNLGTVTALGLEVAIDCTVLGLIELDCIYGSEEIELQAEGALYEEGTGSGMITAGEIELEELEGGGHCPGTVEWGALYEPSEHVYIVE